MCQNPRHWLFTSWKLFIPPDFNEVFLLVRELDPKVYYVSLQSLNKSYKDLLTYFLPLVSFCTPRKRQKTSWFFTTLFRPFKRVWKPTFIGFAEQGTKCFSLNFVKCKGFFSKSQTFSYSFICIFKKNSGNPKLLM